MAGWVVGKSDFNENPVVSLDLDLDFGLRLRVCQKRTDRQTYRQTDRTVIKLETKKPRSNVS